MGFFGDDAFDEIVRNFFGGSGKGDSFYRNSGSSRRNSVNPVVGGKNIFLVFDFSEFDSVKVSVDDELVENEYGEKVYTGKKVLEIVGDSGKIGEFVLPKKIKPKDFSYTFTNGILEVKFKK